jgi:predicted HD phosphohydrolase
MSEWIYTQMPADGTADLTRLHPKFDPKRGRNYFLPDRILDELRSPGFKLQGRYGQTVLGHSLQSATMAERDGHDDEYVICCLVHDVMHNFAPGLAHADLAAALVQPYVSEANHWMVKHHNIFVGHYVWEKIGRDPNAREQFKDSPYFDYTDEFVVKYDNPARDPEYPNEPIEHFESRVRDIFGKVPKVEKDPYAVNQEMLKANGYAR